MTVFEVNETDFPDLDSFNQSLSSLDSDELNTDLYLVVGFSHLSEREVSELLRRRGYSLTDLGAVDKIGKTYTNGSSSDDETENVAEYYFHYDEETGLMLFYTDMRKTEEIESTVLPMLENEPDVHYLHVSPRVFQSLRDKIENETHAEIPAFVADRSEESDFPARIRGEYKRTIQYDGADGIKTLTEMETNYGVRPRNITFEITNKAKFRVTRKGVFAYSSGNMSRFFEYVQTAVNKALEVKRAFDASSFEMVSTTESLSVPTSEPTTIHLDHTLEYNEVGAIESRLEDEGYLVVDSFAQEGSVYFTSKIIDIKKDNKFRVEATEDTIHVFPQETEDNVGSFLRFYEFVETNIDPNSTVSTAEAEG